MPVFFVRKRIRLVFSLYFEYTLTDPGLSPLQKETERTEITMKTFDAVVVGAGNAGLSAALRLQNAGRKTLLIEQHNLPGGCATSFVRGRFEFEPSLHELCDVGTEENPGEVRKLFEEYGVKLDWAQCPDCFRFVSKYSDGTPMDVTMPHGIDAFVAKMEEYVPGSKDKMYELFDIYEEIRQGANYTSACNGKADPKVMQEKYPNMLRLGAYPTSRVFKAMKLPQRCQDILSTYWGYLGVDLNHLSFFHYASMMQRYVSMGAAIPQHTSHEISMAMLNRFYELGGEAWFNCRAEEFLFDEEGGLKGVRTTLGDVATTMCLPNINPDIIYAKMMPKELVPEREKKLVAARGQDFSARMFCAYFGLDCDYHELGITNYTYFIGGSADSESEYHKILGPWQGNEFAIFNCLNVVLPDCSPKGTCICSITTFGSKEDWDNVSQEDYAGLKEKVTEHILEMVKDKLGIDISGHIEEISIASPWTFARYLNAPEGAVYGYEARDWDGIMARMMMLKQDYPIKGLRPIGAAGPRGDGYSGAYITGNLLGKLALADLKNWEEEGKK